MVFGDIGLFDYVFGDGDEVFLLIFYWFVFCLVWLWYGYFVGMVGDGNDVFVFVN